MAARNGVTRKRPAVVTVDQAIDDLYACSNLPTIATPLPRLNTALGGGLIAGQVVVMPGATGTGKTSLLAAFATHSASTSAVVFATYELPVRLLVARIAGQQLDEQWLDIIRGRIDRAKLSSVIPRGIEFLHRPEPAELEYAVKAASDREGSAPLVCLDYLQIMQALSNSDDPRIATASTSAQVRDLADSTNAPVLLAAAVSRESSKVLRQARRSASPSELAGIARDVSNVEYDAAAVLALAVSPDDTEGYQTAMMAVSKNRFGPHDMIGLRYEGRSGRWYESMASLEPDQEELDEMDDAIIRSVRMSRTHLSKRSIVQRNGKQHVAGRKQTIDRRIDELVEEGRLAAQERTLGNGRTVREYSLPPTQQVIPGYGSKPRARGSRNHSVAADTTE